MENKEIILDFTGCKYFTEMHWIIRDTFHFPEYYGENLSALWDMGTDYIGSDEELFEHVRIRGANELPEEFRNYFFEEIMGIFHDIEEFNGNVKFEIEG